MSAVWWGRESAHPEDGKTAAGGQPILAPSTREAVSREARDRIAAYTPEWTSARATDAGQALVKLFSVETESVLERTNRLPEKAFVEYLRTAGVQPNPATAATAMLKLEVSDGATESVLVNRGFQVGARPATGAGDQVIFETERTVFAAPGKIAEMHSQQRGLFLEIDASSTDEKFRFQPFGKKQRPGDALLIGIASAATRLPSLSLGIRVAQAPGAPPPVPVGGVAPLPVPPAPLLRWEILDGTTFKLVEVTLDDTGGLLRSGVVELRLPERWREGRPDGLTGDKQLRWLRLRLVFGTYPEPPSLRSVDLNVVPAIAARTIRNEVLEAAPGTGGRTMRLSQTPVLQGSLTLEVAEGGFDETPQAPAADGREPPGPAPSSGVTRWRSVDDLADYGPDDRVYVLDPLNGLVMFGDGYRGAAVPPGFRNVRALQYRSGGGAAGAAAAGAVSTLVSSAPFLTAVKNPQPATGGTDEESREKTIRRGPREIRARNRAVTVADYALMALRATGAQVARAHAISGFHPVFPGRPVPGVVAVFVVPPRRDSGPPMPVEGDLRGVATSLSKGFAPLGVEVVAAAPKYRKIRAELDVILDPAADSAKVVTAVIDEINTYLDPLKGGEDGEGWPFGQTLEYSSLLRRIVSRVAGVRAVPRLNLIVNGIRTRGCTDVPLRPYELFWPDNHEVVPLGRGEMA